MLLTGMITAARPSLDVHQSVERSLLLMSRSTTRKMLAMRLKAVNGWRWSIRVTRSSASDFNFSR